MVPLVRCNLGGDRLRNTRYSAAIMGWVSGQLRASTKSMTCRERMRYLSPVRRLVVQRHASHQTKHGEPMLILVRWLGTYDAWALATLA